MATEIARPNTDARRAMMSYMRKRGGKGNSFFVDRITGELKQILYRDTSGSWFENIPSSQYEIHISDEWRSPFIGKDWLDEMIEDRIAIVEMNDELRA